MSKYIENKIKEYEEFEDIQFKEKEIEFERILYLEKLCRMQKIIPVPKGNWFFSKNNRKCPECNNNIYIQQIFFKYYYESFAFAKCECGHERASKSYF